MSAGNSKWLIEHRRSTRAESRSMLLSFAVFLPVFVILSWFLFREPSSDFDGHPGFLYCWYALMAVLTPFACYVAWLNWKADAEFVFRLSAEWLECQCPIKGCGESYRIAVSQIDALESEESGEKWFVWDKARRRYWLNSNYGNPVVTVLQKLHELRPELRD